MLPWWKYAAGYLNKVNKLWATPFFLTRDVEIGRYTRFGRNVIFNCRKVRIGHGCIFHDNTVINADVFEIGDYGVVGPDNFFPGPGQVTIGHNFWSGKSCVIDAQGPTQIGHNVCVSVGSQLWSHVSFGDTLAGCRFDAVRPLVVEDDVWISPNCCIAPVHLRQQSMVMMGSVLTKDTQPNRVYAGNPATDITDKTWPQFAETDTEARIQELSRRLDLFGEKKKMSWQQVAVVAGSPDDIHGIPAGKTVFFVSTRTYRPVRTGIEYELIRFLLPKAKFLPV